MGNRDVCPKLKRKDRDLKHGKGFTKIPSRKVKGCVVGFRRCWGFGQVRSNGTSDEAGVRHGRVVSVPTRIDNTRPRLNNSSGWPVSGVLFERNPCHPRQLTNVHSNEVSRNQKRQTCGSFTPSLETSNLWKDSPHRCQMSIRRTPIRLSPSEFGPSLQNVR